MGDRVFEEMSGDTQGDGDVGIANLGGNKCAGWAMSD